ncbi:MAG: hypothetical protein EA391_06540 [Balneolaceae bacterium]|nr:MAG: hypothetical protein EA391_06540 [Balneolaceae bacterium]
MEHPIDELIPYIDVEQIVIDRDFSFELIDEPSKILVLLHYYLNDRSKIELEPLTLKIGDISNLKVEKLSNGRLLILDTSRDTLFEYDIADHSYEIVADFGRGPGELQHSMDLTVAGDTVFVARRDMRLSRFICSASCKYDRTAVLDVQPLSIITTNSGLAVSTGLLFGLEDLYSDSGIEFSAINIFDVDSEQILYSFGEVYNSNYIQVLERFARTGMVAFLPGNNNYIWASSWFPYIYLYDENFEIDKVYKLDHHIQNKFTFFPTEQRLSFPGMDRTLINTIKPIGEEKLLLVTDTRTKDQQLEVDTNYSIDYYLIDHLNRESFHIGSDQFTSNDQKLVYITDDELILNKNGDLFRIVNLNNIEIF